MLIEPEALLDKYPATVRTAVLAFQDYVLSEHGNRSGKWPEAKGLIERVADQIVDATNIESSRIDVTTVAAFLHVCVSFRSTDQKPSGFMYPCEAGFKAVIDGDAWMPRSRFTLGHELGHTLFFDLSKSRPKRLFSYATVSVDGRREEALCDAFASCVLLPRKWFPSQFDGATSIEALTDFATARCVSMEVLLRRSLYGFDLFPSQTFYMLFYENGALQEVRRFMGRAIKGKGIPGTHLFREMEQYPASEAEWNLRLRLGKDVELHWSGSCLWVKVRL